MRTDSNTAGRLPNNLPDNNKPQRMSNSQTPYIVRHGSLVRADMLHTPGANRKEKQRNKKLEKRKLMRAVKAVEAGNE